MPKGEVHEKKRKCNARALPGIILQIQSTITKAMGSHQQHGGENLRCQKIVIR